ncbi:hypothetical protein GCK72_004153 [Caenorhabditis remanei]|uniref:Uncharacterized protein n=1 Tax=Caenorhabditis remanei TaxID=31234 RepID=A0A6A5HBL1_CAERE|nr:hypothetical protein GCK72_004153 [Caenorhabditis remanei]KAF1764206.1 hypothetical protein GCK72_004153 [Caenorhabditis remanei]
MSQSSGNRIPRHTATRKPPAPVLMREDAVKQYINGKLGRGAPVKIPGMPENTLYVPIDQLGRLQEVLRGNKEYQEKMKILTSQLALLEAMRMEKKRLDELNLREKAKLIADTIAYNHRKRVFESVVEDEKKKEAKVVNVDNRKPFASRNKKYC